MHVLLTRPLEDSKDLIFNFKSKGFKVSHLPLLNIQKINYEQIDFNSYEALIFTSSNSIRNLETKNINKEHTCAKAHAQQNARKNKNSDSTMFHGCL